MSPLAGGWGGVEAMMTRETPPKTCTRPSHHTMPLCLDCGPTSTTKILRKRQIFKWLMFLIKYLILSFDRICCSSLRSSACVWVVMCRESEVSLYQVGNLLITVCKHIYLHLSTHHNLLSSNFVLSKSNRFVLTWKYYLLLFTILCRYLLF